MEKQLFTAEEISKIFRISNTTLYRLCRKGIIPHIRVGKLYRFYLDDVKEALNAHLQGFSDRGL